MALTEHLKNMISGNPADLEITGSPVVDFEVASAATDGAFFYHSPDR
jgi:hypothetical protein